MQAASPEDPAVSQVLARAGAGNQCLIMDITPGGEFKSSGPITRPAPLLLPVCSLRLDISKQMRCCLCHRQQCASWIPVAWRWLLQVASNMHRTGVECSVSGE